MNFKSYITLKEGLVKTYPLDVAIRVMNNKWDAFLINSFSKSLDSFDGDIIHTKRFDLEKMKKDAESLGYFLSRVYKNNTYWTLSFSPKISETDKSNPLSELYHFCPNTVLHKIQKIGITPRDSTKKDWPHPGDRTYLLKIEFDKMDLVNAVFDISDIKSVFQKIANANNKKFEEYSFIKIKANESLTESLKVDPSFPKRERSYYGVYTNKNIPPSMFTKIIKAEDFDKELINLVVKTSMTKYN